MTVGACRFNEWGRAVLDLQKSWLAQNNGPEYLFTAYGTESKDLETLNSAIAGTLMAALC